MRWVQDFSMKPSAPADDEQAQEYLNKNTAEQMKAIKERLENG
jgi:aromatase